MSREGDLIRRAMKRSLLPALAVLGFSGTSSTFQRLLPEFQDLLAIRYPQELSGPKLPGKSNPTCPQFIS